MTVKQFDYCVSNPPYQNDKNSAIFHNFQNIGDTIATNSTMIYPADKWMTKSGKGVGLDEFTDDQLTSRNLLSLDVYEDANSIFGGIELHGGISILNKSKEYDNQGKIDITTFDFNMVPNQKFINIQQGKTLSISNAMNNIVEKVLNHKDSKEFLSNIVCSTSLYGIGSSFIEKSNNSITDADYANEEGFVKVLTNGTSGTQGRVGWFWIPVSDVPKNSDTVDKYVVAVSTRHSAGYGGRSQQARIFRPGEIFGDSRFGVAIFDTLEEAENFYLWLSSDIVRVLLLSSSRRVKNFGTNVPVLKSYKNTTKEIDFTKNINEQLIAKYELSAEDLQYIDSTIKTLGSFEMIE